MRFGWAIVIAASAVAFVAGPAASQAVWPQAEPQGAQAPWPGQQPQAQQQAAPAAQSPWDQPQAAPPQAGAAPWPQPQQQAPARAMPGPDPWSQPPPPPQDARTAQCLEEFVTLRKHVEKHGGAIQTASQRKVKPSAQVACGLFNAFTAAERKMYVYATKNAASCGIPPQVIENLKQARAKSDDIRTKVCQAAASGGPQRAPAPPSLSDALSAPVPDSANIKTGRGTYDTLTGSPLGR
ncbi:MAG: hypothetical protein Q8M24_17505 [Pseudolabrys sp.]|nr:hypothetical protein [Pseudolabrys sp.]MDP2297244.1 hypothetical protein [Pseudolabrys sp.]